MESKKPKQRKTSHSHNHLFQQVSPVADESMEQNKASMDASYSSIGSLQSDAVLTRKSSFLANATTLQPPSSSNATPNSVPVSNRPPRARRRKEAHPNKMLFFILKSFAYLGPLGFMGNILYFTIHMHSADYHLNFHAMHPLSAISQSLHHRLTAMGLEESPSEGRVVSGKVVLRQLEQRIQASFQECGGNPKSALALSQQLLRSSVNDERNHLRHGKNNYSHLPPFGILQDLQAHSDDINATVSCQIPQRGINACKDDHYSIVVLFHGVHNFRPLFMNLLTWLTYPNIKSITVVMPHADWTYEQQSVMDSKYKNRIQTWHGNAQHKVSMIGLPEHVDTKDTDSNGKFSPQRLLSRGMDKLAGSNAILFVDGTVLWNGNKRGIQAGFNLWKQNPHAIIAAQNLEAENPTATLLNCEDHSFYYDPESLLASFCPNADPPLPTNLQSLHQQYQNIIDLNGVFVHKGLLCLIQRSPLATIVGQTIWSSLLLDNGSTASTTTTFVTLRSVLALLLQQITATPPLLYPASITRPKNETKHYNTNWHYMPSKKEQTEKEQRRHDNTQIQKDVLVAMLSYFGSGLAANAQDGLKPYWCASNKNSWENVFYAEDIPWLLESKC